jgi:hypothetical protein
MAKPKKIERKGVAFNVLDPDQRKLFDYAAHRSNFSAYVKRLIQRDMEGGVFQNSDAQPLQGDQASDDFNPDLFL